MPRTAYELGAALWAEIPDRDRDNWSAFGEHDEIPDGDYRALQSLYPAEYAALDGTETPDAQAVWRRIERDYRRGYNDARGADIAES